MKQDKDWYQKKLETRKRGNMRRRERDIAINQLNYDTAMRENVWSDYLKEGQSMEDLARDIYENRTFNQFPKTTGDFAATKLPFGCGPT